MEEAGGEINNNDIIQTRKILVNTSEIIKKFKSFKARQMFCRELSKIIPIIFRFIFPEGMLVRLNFFFKISLRGKKVFINYIIYSF